MDWATDHAWRTPARRAAIILGLLACGADLGCARMNSFLRDEPPMLGARNATPTTASARANGPATATARGQTGRAAPTSDLYAQSFGRTRPRPAASPAATQEEPGTAAPSSAPDPAPAPENGVHTTALDASPEAGNPLGVLLKPPVSTATSPGAATRPASQPPAPDAPVATPPATPAETPAPSAAAARRRPGEVAQGEASPATVESLVAAARERLETFHSYQVAINRQERVGDHLQEPEDVVLSIRRNPRAVRLQWPDGPHRGREVLFSERETNGLMQVNMADSTIPLPRLALPPESPLVLRTSRHPITEAGFETLVRNLEKTIEENKAGDHSHGQISYAGVEQPGPLDHPCHKIVRVTATGETWQVFLDPASKLPAMVQGNAPNGDLLERYLFRDIQPDPPELAVADAFDPKLRWGETKGLLSRLSNAAGRGSREQPTGPATTR